MAEILTGNVIVDSLRRIQKAANRLDTTAERIRCFEIARQALGTQRLLGRSLMISTSLAFGRDPDMPPDSTIMFEQGLMLSGKLEQFDYLDYPKIPIDSLALGIDAPQIFTDDPEEIEAFSRLSLRVPILAIDTCVSLDLD